MTHLPEDGVGGGRRLLDGRGGVWGSQGSADSRDGAGGGQRYVCIVTHINISLSISQNNGECVTVASN